ncbi:MAG: cytochrome c oxidase subunit II [Planctomycetota bacterium]
MACHGFAEVVVWGESLSVFDPASGSAASIRDLFFLVLGITGAIFVVFEGVLLYCILRFRKSRESDATEPPQLYGSMPVELAWTIAPLVICFVLFLVVARTVIATREEEPPPGAVRVIAVGHQWWWEFRYPDLGIVTANELHVPLGNAENRRPVYIELQSADVIHSFWVPRLGGKTDLIPGRKNTMWFEPSAAGVFLGQCAEYCGTQHANMLLRVTVESPEDFDRWAADQKKPGSQEEQVKADRDLFLSQACMNCHTIAGTTAKGKFGPDLTHLMSRQTIGSGVAPNDHENLKKWVYDAPSLKPGCKMPSLHLSEAEVERIVRYLETLK